MGINWKLSNNMLSCNHYLVRYNYSVYSYLVKELFAICNFCSNVLKHCIYNGTAA
mgnify:CR=1 FL=1